PAPEIRVQQMPDRFELRVSVSLSELLVLDGQIRFGLSAVIEAANGSLSYWALKHPAEEPDFHHPDSFTLSLNADSADSAGIT
ncbi:MAG: hypothetical protein ACRES4_11180, partial [Nevskiales bacterium]